MVAWDALKPVEDTPASLEPQRIDVGWSLRAALGASAHLVISTTTPPQCVKKTHQSHMQTSTYSDVHLSYANHEQTREFQGLLVMKKLIHLAPLNVLQAGLEWGLWEER